MVGYLLCGALWIFVTLALYRLFKGVNQALAVLMVILGSLMVTPNEKCAMSSRSWLITIALLLLAAGVASGYASHGEGNRDVYALMVWPLYVLTYCWMKSDAKRLSVQPPAGAIPMIPLLLPIALSYYLFGTRRGWRGAGSLCIAALAIASLCALMLLGEYVGSALSA
jgi:hypothetical protein